MKIHAAYNVFDNEELLEDSIRSIREFVDEVTIIYQKVSNFGQPCDPHLEDLLRHLRDDRLVDTLVSYNVQNVSPDINERKKNNIGYEFAKKSKSDYHMVMNCDEFYFKEGFLEIVELLKKYPVDVVTSYMYTYYKSSKYRFKEIENYSVAVMNKVCEGREYIQMAPNPLLLDPSRRMSYDSCFCFPKTTPHMHHLSHVRKDFSKKLLNSTARAHDPQFETYIPKMVECYQNWRPVEDAFLFGKYVELERTDAFDKEIKFD